MKEKGQNVERKNVKQKRDGTETQNEDFSGWLFVRRNEERKRINKEFQKPFNNNKNYFTHFFKNKRTEKEEKWQKEKTEDVFSNLLEKHFFRYIKTRKYKWETDFFQKKKKEKEKENKKGELKQKTRNHFSRHRKTNKTGKYI